MCTHSVFGSVRKSGSNETFASVRYIITSSLP